MAVNDVFFVLPRETRDEIYQHFFEPAIIKFAFTKSLRTKGKQKKWYTMRRRTAVPYDLRYPFKDPLVSQLMVSRQWYSETVAKFYNANCFHTSFVQSHLDLVKLPISQYIYHASVTVDYVKDLNKIIGAASRMINLKTLTLEADAGVIYYLLNHFEDVNMKGHEDIAVNQIKKLLKSGVLVCPVINGPYFLGPFVQRSDCARLAYIFKLRALGRHIPDAGEETVSKSENDLFESLDDGEVNVLADLFEQQCSSI